VAGDWIKMRADLQSHPKVVRISSALGADRLRVIGGLHAVWCLFDMHSTDGRLEGYTAQALDDLIGFGGFSKALAAVGWLEIHADCLCTPRFEEHNGQSAKRRAQETERKRNDRKLSALDADEKRTREEKRREEINTPHTPRRGQPLRSLKAWMAEIKAAGEKALPEEDPIFEYAKSVGLPYDFLRLAWREFVAKHSEPNAKRQKDWRAHFRNAVRGNWAKLWWVDESGYRLTTAGEQAKRAHEDRSARTEEAREAA
jgi:hypothetical protein